MGWNPQFFRQSSVMLLCALQELGPPAMYERCRREFIAQLQGLAFVEGGKAVSVLVCFFLGRGARCWANKWKS